MILLSLHFYSILKCTQVTKYGIYDFTLFHIYFIVKCTQVKVTGCGPLLIGGRSAITKMRVDTSVETRSVISFDDGRWAWSATSIFL